MAKSKKMDNYIEKSFLDISNNNDVILFLSQKLDELSYSVNTFFEYIVTPRDGYVIVNKTNIKNKIIQRPMITRQIVEYVLRNVLDVVMDLECQLETSYSPVFKHYIQYSKLSSFADKTVDNYNFLFASQMTPKVQDLFDELDSSLLEDKDNKVPMFKRMLPYVAEDIDVPVLKYLNYLLSTVYDNDPDQSQETIKENIAYFKMREGTNTFIPKDYGFMDDYDNVITQSFVWMICGLTDWLEKEFVDVQDVVYMSKIMFPKQFEDIKMNFLTEKKQFYTYEVSLKKKASDPQRKLMYKLAQKQEEKNVTAIENLKTALFINNFFVSEKAVELMENIMYFVKNIDDEEYKDRLKEIIVRYSIII